MEAFRVQNAKQIFVSNGNPRNDPLQIECLRKNKIAIDECLKNLDAVKNVINNEQMQENEEYDDDDEATKPVLNQNKVKTQHKKRRRASKQRLRVKKNDKNEVEEGEIVSFIALNEAEMDEIDNLFEFMLRFDAKDVIQKVVVLQHGFDGFDEFEAYRKRIESQGSNLSMDLKQKNAKIQREIIGILRRAKKKIFEDNKESVYVFKEIVKNKKMQKIKQKQMKMIKMQQIEKENEEKEKKKKEAMNVDRDSSDDEFDDRLYVEPTLLMTTAENENIIAKHAETLMIGKDDYHKTEHQPVRPSNVDSEKWKEFAIDYTNEQNEDEFDF